MAKKAWLRFLLPGVLILIVGVGLGVKYGMERAVAEDILAQFPDRGVPRMNISLNGVTLDEIKAGSKDTKYEGNDVTVYEGDSATLEAGGVRVKGRGNGTWIQEKKPYQIKFDKKVDLFGMGKAKKWVLLANAMDATNLRNEAAFYLGKMLEMEYILNGKFVELYFDGEYEGLYYLTHVVEIGKTSVDLKDSMGVLVELDNVYGGLEDYYITRNGELLALRDAVSKDDGEKAMDSFVRDFDELEIAIEEKDYERMSKIIDVESFAKYYLLSEFIVNPDAYWTSFYFYKDGFEDKIHAGPGWDFDLAFANRSWGNWMGEEFFSPRRSMVRKDELLPREVYEELGLIGETDWYEMSLGLSHIIYDMMEMPEFVDEVKETFGLIKGRSNEFVSQIRKDEQMIVKAMGANSDKWGKEWYRDEINDMIEWIKLRFDYLEERYGVETIDDKIE